MIESSGSGILLWTAVALADNCAVSAWHCQLKPFGESVRNPHSTWKKKNINLY